MSGGQRGGGDGSGGAAGKEQLRRFRGQIILAQRVFHQLADDETCAVGIVAEEAHELDGQGFE